MGVSINRRKTEYISREKASLFSRGRIKWRPELNKKVEQHKLPEGLTLVNCERKHCLRKTVLQRTDGWG